MCSLAGTAVSRHLSRGALSCRFPGTASTLRITNALDTPENRFVRHFLVICENILHSFKEKVSERSALNGREILNEIGEMDEKINSLLANPFFDDVGDFTGFPGNSTVMQKRQGYKEILKFYNLIQSAVSFPMFEDSIRLAVENRDIAELYEIWAYFRIVDLIGEITGSHVISANLYDITDYSVSLKYYASVVYKYRGQEITVWYNRSYTRGNDVSYSLPLRPDIVVETADGLYIFDAKFRLRTLNWDEEAEERDFTFKNGDIYKMHTYKDAIRGVKTAVILYPNKDTKQDRFWDDKEPRSGVGAYALLPGLNSDNLKKFIRETVLEID